MLNNYIMNLNWVQTIFGFLIWLHAVLGLFAHINWVWTTLVVLEWVNLVHSTT